MEGADLEAVREAAQVEARVPVKVPVRGRAAIEEGPEGQTGRKGARIPAAYKRQELREHPVEPMALRPGAFSNWLSMASRSNPAKKPMPTLEPRKAKAMMPHLAKRQAPTLS
jgi:hypothetical protein